MKLVALVPAAGDGRRQQARQRKLFQRLDDRPVLAHTLARLQDCARVDQIYPIVPVEEVEFVREQIVRPGGFSKVVDVLPGGLLRQDTLLRALVRIGPGTELVLLHDGSRPLVTQELLLRTIAAAEVHGAATCAVPVHDTIKNLSRENFINGSLERRRLRAIQTPQVFRYDILLRAHEQASRENFYGSDEVLLVERIGERIKVVAGSHLNLYVATREDLTLARALLGVERELQVSNDPLSGDGLREEREKERETP